ncbi:hypothetical protein [Caulobacter sp. 1776]|uniref:hypothetical protein n=1 Tax=Caulobacter sp. 1776 TaxID=3156420 RepID=UPI00339A760F
MPDPLIFVGVADERRTFVDFGAEIGDPRERAHGLLDEHRSCDRIEIWREERCIAVVSRQRSGPTA